MQTRFLVPIQSSGPTDLSVYVGASSWGAEQPVKAPPQKAPQGNSHYALNTDLPPHRIDDQNRYLPLHPPTLGVDTADYLATVTQAHPTPVSMPDFSNLTASNAVGLGLALVLGSLTGIDVINLIDFIRHPKATPRASELTEEISVLWYPCQSPRILGISHIESSDGPSVFNSLRHLNKGSIESARAKAKIPGKFGFVELTLGVTAEEKARITANINNPDYHLPHCSFGMNETIFRGTDLQTWALVSALPANLFLYLAARHKLFGDRYRGMKYYGNNPARDFLFSGYPMEIISSGLATYGAALLALKYGLQIYFAMK